MVRKLIALVALSVVFISLESQSWSAGDSEVGDTPTKEPVGNQNNGVSGWFEFKSPPGYLGWYRNGVLHGRWHNATKTWQEWDGNQFLPPSDPPWAASKSQPFFGVEEDKLIPIGEKWYLGGTPLDQESIQNLITDPSKDDSLLPQVCILDIDANRRKESFENLTNRFAGKARVSAADPTNKDQKAFLEGFKLDKDERFKKNNFGTFVLGPRETDGFAKIRYVAYDPKAAQALGDEISVKVDPAYDPSKNPSGGGDAKPVDWSWLGKAFWYVVALLFGGGVVYGAMSKDDKNVKVIPEYDPMLDEGDEEEEAYDSPEYSPTTVLLTALQQWRDEQKARDEEYKSRTAENEELRKSLLEIANSLGKERGA